MRLSIVIPISVGLLTTKAEIWISCDSTDQVVLVLIWPIANVLHDVNLDKPAALR